MSAPRTVRVGLGLILVLLVSFVLGAVAWGEPDVARWPARLAISVIVALVFAVGERWRS